MGLLRRAARKFVNIVGPRAANRSGGTSIDLDALLEPRANLDVLGSHYGGWAVPVDLIHEQSIVYSAGAGEDLTFDCALTRRFGCQVEIFDPTPRAKIHFDKLVAFASRATGADPAMRALYDVDADVVARLRFHPVGLWSETKQLRFYAPKNPAHVSHSIVNLQKTDTFFEAWCHPLSKLMKDLGHERIDLLKLDIEGAEYEVLKNILDERIPIEIIAVEFDEGNVPLDAQFLDRILDMIARMRAANYTLVDRKGWNFTFLSKPSHSKSHAPE